MVLPHSYLNLSGSDRSTWNFRTEGKKYLSLYVSVSPKVWKWRKEQILKSVVGYCSLPILLGLNKMTTQSQMQTTVVKYNPGLVSFG